MTGRQKMIVGWAGFVIAWLVIFAVMEGYALMQSDPADGITLSRLVVELSQRWPPFVFFSGVIIGALASHFWWRWNPEDPHDRRG